MSERPFFTLRYASPGYTFILVTVLVAYPELQEMISQAALTPEQVTLIVAFLGLLALLSGGALGFLVSQVWYHIYRHYLRLNYGRLPDTMRQLTERYRLRNDPQLQTIFLDYVHRISSKTLRNYTERRYDLMQLSGSTLISAFLGSIFGVIIQIYLLGTTTEGYGSVIMGIGFALALVTFLVVCWQTRARARRTPFPSHLTGLSKILSLAPAMLLLIFGVGARVRVHDCLVFFLVVFVVLLLFSSLQHAQTEHSVATEVSVNEVVSWLKEFPRWKAEQVFPPRYFGREGQNEET